MHNAMRLLRWWLNLLEAATPRSTPREGWLPDDDLLTEH
jgi:hypothetical protein